MNKKSLLLLVIFFAVQLVGCAGHIQSESKAPVIEQSKTVSKPEVKEPEKALPQAPTQSTPTTKPPVAPAATTNAVTSLVNEARAQYAAKNYQGAVATAERGLRIDRRAPELYLILAQSYYQLANTQLAQQFVQQGIRYAQAGSDVAQALLKLKDALP